MGEATDIGGGKGTKTALIPLNYAFRCIRKPAIRECFVQIGAACGVNHTTY